MGAKKTTGEKDMKTVKEIELFGRCRILKERYEEEMSETLAKLGIAIAQQSGPRQTGRTTAIAEACEEHDFIMMCTTTSSARRVRKMMDIEAHAFPERIIGRPILYDPDVVAILAKQAKDTITGMKSVIDYKNKQIEMLQKFMEAVGKEIPEVGRFVWDRISKQQDIQVLSCLFPRFLNKEGCENEPERLGKDKE